MVLFVINSYFPVSMNCIPRILPTSQYLGIVFLEFQSLLSIQELYLWSLTNFPVSRNCIPRVLLGSQHLDVVSLELYSFPSIYELYPSSFTHFPVSRNCIPRILLTSQYLEIVSLEFYPLPSIQELYPTILLTSQHLGIMSLEFYPFLSSAKMNSTTYFYVGFSKCTLQQLYNHLLCKRKYSMLISVSILSKLRKLSTQNQNISLCMLNENKTKYKPKLVQPKFCERLAQEEQKG